MGLCFRARRHFELISNCDAVSHVWSFLKLRRPSSPGPQSRLDRTHSRPHGHQPRQHTRKAPGPRDARPRGRLRRRVCPSWLVALSTDDPHVTACYCIGRFPGRWLAPDPLFVANPEKSVESQAECNLNSYAGHNPVRFVNRSDLVRFFVDGGDVAYAN